MIYIESAGFLLQARQTLSAKLVQGLLYCPILHCDVLHKMQWLSFMVYPIPHVSSVDFLLQLSTAEMFKDTQQFDVTPSTHVPAEPLFAAVTLSQQ